MVDIKTGTLGVCIQVIEHSKQRYNTIGDWWLDRDTGILEIRVSQLDSWKREMLVAYHEFTEAMLCLERGIHEEAVTAFDIEYEKKRKPGDDSEPGDSIKAPYYREHQFATAMESFLATQLQVDWDKYEAEIVRISDTYPIKVEVI